MTSLLLLGLLLTSPDPGEPFSRRLFHGWSAGQVIDGIVLTRAASNMLEGEPGDRDVLPNLVLIGNGDRISASVELSGWVSRQRPVSIPLSLDGGPFVQHAVHGGLDTVYFDRPKTVIQQLLQHHHLVVRVLPPGQPKSQDIHFELDGLDRVIWPLADACGWDPGKSDVEEAPNASQ